MAGTECIVNVEVSQLRERCTEGIDLVLGTLHFLSVYCAFAFFSHVEPKVLEEEDFAVAGIAASSLNF